MEKVNFKKKKTLPVVLFFLSIILLNSCYKDRFGFDKISGGTWDPSLAAPVINSSLTIDKIAKNDPSNSWVIYPDGLVGLVYRDSFFSDYTNNFVDFPDQQKDTVLYYKTPSGIGAGDNDQKNYLINSAISMTTGEKLDSVFFKDGTLKFSITTNLNHNAKFTLVIPKLNSYGKTFRGVIPFTYTGGSSNTVTASFPIGLYDLVITSGKLEQYLSVDLDFGNNSILNSYTFNFSEKIEDLKYYEAKGFFNQHFVDLNESEIKFDIFETNTLGTTVLEDPIIKFKVFNSYGMPLDLNLTKLEVSNGTTTLPLTSSLLPVVGLNYPAFQNPHIYSVDTFQFNKSNSNIKALFDLNPKKISLKGSIKTNPLGTIIPNYILDTSRIGIMMDVELPLYGKAYNFNIYDTVPFEISDPNELASLDFYINTYNEFPVDARIQIYLLDDQKNVLDSLISNSDNIINSATPGPGPDYRTINKVHKLTVSSMTDAKLRKLDRMKYMSFKATISTADAGTKIVKIYSDYALDFKVAIKAKLKVEL